jgi:hypothetical protein
MLLFSQFNFVQSQDFQWEVPVKISNNPKGWCISPTICDDVNGNLYVVFTHYNLNESQRLYFNWFDGKNWQGIDTLYQHQNYDVYSPKILSDLKKNLHLSFEIAYGEYGRLYYMGKENENWSTPVQISEDSLGSTHGHDIVVDNFGKVHIFFNADDIYYRVYYDSILSNIINITNLDLEQYKTLSPKAVIDSENNIYLTYQIKNDLNNVSDLFFSKYNGQVWSDPIGITEIDDLSCWYQAMTLDSENNLHIVWDQQLTKLDTVLGNPTIVSYKQVYYANNVAGKWLPPDNISKIPNSSSIMPKLKIYKNNPIVFFEIFYEDISGQDKYYAHRVTDGWVVKKWDVEFNTTKFFDFFIDSSELIHIATCSQPITQRGDVEYVKGNADPSSIKPIIRYSSHDLHLKNYPNPFNNKTKIHFYLDKSDNIEVKIFDINCKLVKIIVSNQRLNAGMHLYYWDAINNHGKEVSSGIYFLVILRNSEIVNSRKIILFK